MSPNRALLAQVLAMYFDTETDEERTLIHMILVVQFGDPRHIKWLDAYDPPSSETHLSRGDAAATDKMRDVFASILRKESTSASN